MCVCVRTISHGSACVFACVSNVLVCFCSYMFFACVCICLHFWHVLELICMFCSFSTKFAVFSVFVYFVQFVFVTCLKCYLNLFEHLCMHFCFHFGECLGVFAVVDHFSMFFICFCMYRSLQCSAPCSVPFLGPCRAWRVSRAAPCPYPVPCLAMFLGMFLAMFRGCFFAFCWSRTIFFYFPLLAFICVQLRSLLFIFLHFLPLLSVFNHVHLFPLFPSASLHFP